MADLARGGRSLKPIVRAITDANRYSYCILDDEAFRSNIFADLNADPTMNDPNVRDHWIYWFDRIWFSDGEPLTYFKMQFGEYIVRLHEATNAK